LPHTPDSCKRSALGQSGDRAPAPTASGSPLPRPGRAFTALSLLAWIPHCTGTRATIVRTARDSGAARPTRVPGNYPHADRLRWRDDIHLAYRQRPWLSLSFQSLVIRTAQIPSASDFSRAPSGLVSVWAGNLGAEFWPRRFPRLTELRPNPPVQSMPRRGRYGDQEELPAQWQGSQYRFDPILLRARLQAGGSHEDGGGTILSRLRRGGAPG
jgi:hypothetical protein